MVYQNMTCMKIHKRIWGESGSTMRKMLGKNICSLCYNTCFDETGVDIKRKEASCISERNACQRRLEHYHETLENQPDSLEFLNDIKWNKLSTHYEFDKF